MLRQYFKEKFYKKLFRNRMEQKVKNSKHQVVDVTFNNKVY